MKWRGASAAAALVLLLRAATALADEGGASVWLPGQFASFAAVPGDPGFSVETILYTRLYARKASASAGTSFSRGGSLLAGIDVSEQYIYITPSYTFREPVLHGQLSIGVTFSAGRNDTSVWGSLTGPLGGAYDPNRLAGVGLGHWALDAGMGYTFLSPGGFELSLTAGMTYNFFNPSTQYQSGMDGHIDLGTSYALSESFYVGAVGYLYNQISPDTGGPALLGGFRSRVAGAGPQAGWSFTVGSVAADLNLRGYKEFAVQNRPEGWNVWLTVSLSAAKREARA